MTMTPFKPTKRGASVLRTEIGGSFDIDDVLMNDPTSGSNEDDSIDFSSDLPSSSDLSLSIKRNDVRSHSSPTRVGISPTCSSSAANRLFRSNADDCGDSSNLPPSPPRVLKPLDLNLDLSVQDSSGLGTTAMGTSSHSSRRREGLRPPPPILLQRKRHAETEIMVGRSLSFEEVDQDDGESNNDSNYVMMSCSSAASPGNYSYLMSPPDSQMMSLASKSPSSFRTMDGRTVQSKNPFSPMLTEESTPSGASAAEELLPTIVDSLTLPASFEDKGSYNKKKSFVTDGSRNNDILSLPTVSTPLLRHRLHKRDSVFESPTRTIEPSQFSSVARDGYPNRAGLYSFTGSPIPETSMEHDHPFQLTHNNSNGHHHKLRKFTKGDDVVTASHYGGDMQGHTEGATSGWRRELHVETQDQGYSTVTRSDDISPTDIFSFPNMSSPKSSRKASPIESKETDPTSPSRSTSYYYNRTNNTGGSRTPVKRSASAAPPTPMPSRRRITNEMPESTRKPIGSASRSHEAHDSGGGRFHSDFDIIGELGKGSFGKVYKVLSRLDGCMYAVKTAHRPAKGNADKDRMLKEVYALAALSDQADTATFHIVRYHQAWMEENRLYIQTELCTSTLGDEMRKKTNAGVLVMSAENRRYKFLREILLALEFIHRHGMVHLDIKPDNIFLKNDQFKLGDFGLVSKISYHKDVEEGDSRYMPMELLSGQHDDLTKSDIFSLGITLYEVCINCNDNGEETPRALPTNGPEWQALRACKISMSDATVPQAMQLIIRQMMNPSAAARPAASELLKRPQLLSDEQKELLAEKNKVIKANLALVAQEQKLRLLSPMPVPRPRRKALVRASTWNGS